MRLRFFFLVLPLLVFGNGYKANAGFEWVPPEPKSNPNVMMQGLESGAYDPSRLIQPQEPVIMPRIRPPSVEQSPLLGTNNNPMEIPDFIQGPDMGRAMQQNAPQMITPPVMQEAQSQTPVYIRRQREAGISADNFMKGDSAAVQWNAPQQAVNNNFDGLFIDPYPLSKQGQVPLPQFAVMPSSTMETAMIEKAELLSPLPGQVDIADDNVSSKAKSAVMATQEKAAQKQAQSISFSSAPNTFAPNNRQNMQAENFENAIGFGKDLPLPMAVMQVVPNGFIPSYDGAVDKGVRVSWNGGKPWPNVLEEMLSPLGLDVVVLNNQVLIRRAG